MRRARRLCSVIPPTAQLLIKMVLFVFSAKLKHDCGTTEVFRSELFASWIGCVLNFFYSLREKSTNEWMMDGKCAGALLQSQTTKSYSMSSRESQKENHHH